MAKRPYSNGHIPTALHSKKPVAKSVYYLYIYGNDLLTPVNYLSSKGSILAELSSKVTLIFSCTFSVPKSLNSLFLCRNYPRALLYYPQFAREYTRKTCFKFWLVDRSPQKGNLKSIMFVSKIEFVVRFAFLPPNGHISTALSCKKNSG